MTSQNWPLSLLGPLGLKACNTCKNSISAPVNKIDQQIKIFIFPCRKWGPGSMPPGLLGNNCREIVLSRPARCIFLYIIISAELVVFI